MQRIWFRRKLYGWGWTPCTWEGWLTIFIFLVLTVLNFFRLDANSHSNSDTIRPFIIQYFILIAVLLLICYKKGEKPRWQWGKRKED